MSDPIADMLTRIRNAQRASLQTVEVPYSKLKESMANLLKREGYITDVAVEGKAIKKMTIKLKYDGLIDADLGVVIDVIGVIVALARISYQVQYSQRLQEVCA